jgi:hypothetical protein
MKIDKKEWEKELTLAKKELLKIFLAGATVATIIWFLVFYIYMKTGFIL